MEILAWTPSGHSAKREDHVNDLTRFVTYCLPVMIPPAKSKKVRMPTARKPWLVNGMALILSLRIFNGKLSLTFLEVASRYSSPQRVHGSR